MSPAEFPTCQDYRILELLGEGAMSQVFRAEQVVPVQRPVALKVLRWSTAPDAFHARFEAERQTLAWLEDERVTRLLGSGTTRDGRPFLAIELALGVPITAYCDEHGLSLRQRVELFLQVCTAVQHAHQRAVLHRDLKPSHLLVRTEDGRPKLKVIDFGIAKLLSPMVSGIGHRTERGEILGTPEYMAPEQADGGLGGVDARTDIYALGVVLHELLVHELPVPSERLRGRDWSEVREVLRTHVRRPMSEVAANAQGASAGNHPDRHHVARAVQGSLDAIVARAIAVSPSARYASVDALANDLQAWLDDRVPAVLVGARWQALRLFVRRQRRRLLVATVAAAALLLGAWLALDARARDADRLRELRVTAQSHRVRAETLASQLTGTVERDASLWDAILENGRLAVRTARAGQDAEQVASMEAFFADVERRTEASRAAAHLIDDKREWIHGLERFVIRSGGPTLQLHQEARAELQQLLDSSRLLDAQRRSLRHEVLTDSAFTEHQRPLLYTCAIRAVFQRAYESTAHARLRHEGLLAHLDAEATQKQMAAGMRLIESLLPLLASLPGTERATGFLDRLHAPGRAEPIPAHVLEWQPENMAESVLLANAEMHWQSSLERSATHLRQYLDAPSQTTRRTAALSLLMRQNYVMAAFPIGADVAVALGGLRPIFPLFRTSAKPADWRMVLGCFPDTDPDKAIGTALVDANSGDLAKVLATATRLDRQRLGDMQLYQLAVAVQTTQDTELAITIYRELVARYPLSPRAWCNLGYLLVAQRDFAGALLARRIGHAIGSVADTWPFPSQRWVEEAQGMQSNHRRLEDIANLTVEAADQQELALAFRYCEMTRSIDAGLRLFARLPNPGPGVFDEQWMTIGIQTSALAVAGVVKPSLSQRTPQELMDMAAATLEQVIDSCWTSYLREENLAGVNRVCFHIRRFAELAAFPALAGRFPNQSQAHWDDLWDRAWRMRETR